MCFAILMIMYQNKKYLLVHLEIHFNIRKTNPIQETALCKLKSTFYIQAYDFFFFMCQSNELYFKGMRTLFCTQAHSALNAQSLIKFCPLQESLAICWLEKGAKLGQWLIEAVQTSRNKHLYNFKTLEMLNVSGFDANSVPLR